MRRIGVLVVAGGLVSGVLPGCGDDSGLARDAALDAARDAASADALPDGGGETEGGLDGRPDGSPGCSGPEDCDDGNPCTRDECRTGEGCVHAEVCCGNGRDDDGDGAADCGDEDCAGREPCAECAPVQEPQPVPEAPLPGESPPGTFESVVEDGFHDDFVFDSTHYLKVGIRREWGGSIVFFGIHDGRPGMNGSNAIDANDTGREVQVAFYDPDRILQNCAWDASCRQRPSECPNTIPFLGWNPVQGGNECNVGSGVEWVDMADGVLTASVHPLFWNPDWDRQDCDNSGCSDPNRRELRSDVRVIQRIRFVRTHVVELDYTLVNLSAVDHAPAAQEMPTVYTANGQAGPDLWRFFNSEGQEFVIDDGSQGDRFYSKTIPTPRGWATMQSDNLDYGVALYTENRAAHFQGWQQRSLPFNNFRPVAVFGIPANGTVRARAYLILGSLATVTAEAQWLDENLPPFGVLDRPGPDESVSGTVQVAGWALDNKGVAQVELLVDGAPMGQLAYGQSRPDVCLVWPGYAGCDQVGYSGTLDVSHLTPCPHLLEVRAVDTDGNARVIARRRIYVTSGP